MSYSSLKECILDLEKHGMLCRVTEEVDPDLEMAEIQRRVYRASGPAIFFERVKGSPFPAVCNLFGHEKQARFIFRDTLERVKKIFRLKADPGYFFRCPWQAMQAAFLGFYILPKRVRGGPVLERKTTVRELPQIRCWPRDGGGYILLPQVYTEHPGRPGIFHSNLGMYRVQMTGNDYEENEEIGMHYQIHRHIGIHHEAAVHAKKPLKVSIFVGGPPAHAFSAAMYLPEGIPEVGFAGALGRRRFRYAVREGFTLSAEADFCITGTLVCGKTKPEGPFGDHLGYYSERHEFPYLKVESVTCRRDAVWPFTVVGRPPQEDSTIAKLVQEIAACVFPSEIPGVKAVHAVAAAGVHPLMFAIGSERYVPYQEREPREILTLAHAILGYGPCSLAKYLIIVAGEDDPDLDICHTEKFISHFLERVDWQRDLHFDSRTTMDTLDYSGSGLNKGSKVVMAAAGKKRRRLQWILPEGLSLPEGFERPRFAMHGVLVVEAPKFQDYSVASAEMKIVSQCLGDNEGLEGIALIVLADNSEFASKNLHNFLWITFTRSDPARDIYGVDSFVEHRHWGCRGSLVIDARTKPHHATPLIEDPAITKRVDALAAPGHSLHGII